MAQGKAFDKKKIMERLEPYFKLGYTRSKACTIAGFDPSLLAKWEKKDPTLSKEIDILINIPNTLARRNLVKDLEIGDIDTSKWWAERREKNDFSTKTEIDEKSDQTININYNEPEE